MRVLIMLLISTACMAQKRPAVLFRGGAMGVQKPPELSFINRVAPMGTISVLGWTHTGFGLGGGIGIEDNPMFSSPAFPLFLEFSILGKAEKKFSPLISANAGMLLTKKESEESEAFLRKGSIFLRGLAGVRFKPVFIQFGYGLQCIEDPAIKERNPVGHWLAVIGAKL